MTTRNVTHVDIVPGELTTVTLPYSEVCMHMGMAGKQMQIVLFMPPAHTTSTPMVQLYQDNGEPFSFPILPGEAGVHRNSDGSFYALLITEQS